MTECPYYGPPVCDAVSFTVWIMTEYFGPLQCDAVALTGWTVTEYYLSSSSHGLLAFVSHEPAVGHEAVPVDSRVTWVEVSKRQA